MVWYDIVRNSTMRCGVVWYCVMVWYGMCFVRMVWYRKIWCCVVCYGWYVRVFLNHGMLWHVWYGTVR